MMTSADDRTLAELRDRHPRWNIWHVPGIGQTTWCAQPKPLLNCASPRQLEEEIRQADTEMRETGSAGGQEAGE